jgi:hypothetical protein
MYSPTESMPFLVTTIVRIGPKCYQPSDRCEKGGSGDCGDEACEGCRYYYGSHDDREHCVFLGGLSQVTDLELSADPDMVC